MLKYSLSCVFIFCWTWCPLMSLNPTAVPAPAAQIWPNRLEWNTQIGKWQLSRQEPGDWMQEISLTPTLHSPMSGASGLHFSPLYPVFSFICFLCTLSWSWEKSTDRSWKKREITHILGLIWTMCISDMWCKGKRCKPPAHSAWFHEAKIVFWRSKKDHSFYQDKTKLQSSIPNDDLFDTRML